MDQELRHHQAHHVPLLPPYLCIVADRARHRPLHRAAPLAHKDVGTTQRYARHADPKSREAADKISLNILHQDANVKTSDDKEKNQNENS